MARLFISHAVADKELVEAFVTLLQTGLDVQRKDIFCSSIEGMKIRPGKSFADFIKAELSHADYVIMIVTPAYYESAFCMCELGGSWLHAKDAFPILVKPITFDNLKAVLHGVQCGKIHDEQDLNQLNDCLAELGIGSPSAARWEVRRDIFLGELPKLLKKLQQQTLVPAADHAKLREKYDGAQEILKQQGEEIETLKGQIEDLKKLKNKDEVKKIVRKGMSEQQQFDELVQAVRKAAAKVPSSGVEVLFHEYNESDYVLGSRYVHEEEWEDAEQAEKDGYVEIDERRVTRNLANPKMQAALSAITDLGNFMHGVHESFSEDFVEEHDVQFDLNSREFWREALEL